MSHQPEHLQLRQESKLRQDPSLKYSLRHSLIHRLKQDRKISKFS